MDMTDLYQSSNGAGSQGDGAGLEAAEPLERQQSTLSPWTVAHSTSAEAESPGTGQLDDGPAGEGSRAGAASALPNEESTMVLPVPTERRTSRRRWPVLLAVAILLLIAGGGATIWLLRPQTDQHYLKALAAAKLSDEYPNDKAAVAHGKSFCRQLGSGHEPKGYAAEKVAVRFYCKSYLPGFTVIPTPAEQQATYLQALRDASLGGAFPSDASAVAHAQSVCARLKSGAKQQGNKADEIGVQTYCSEFFTGFHVLEVATVEGTFTLRDSNPSYYYPSIASGYSSCWGSGGYSDISQGVEVVIKNGSGKVLAHTQLGRGHGSSYSCEFPFTVKLTEGEDDYVVSVGRRGEVHFTFEQLQTLGIALTLGD